MFEWIIFYRNCLIFTSCAESNDNIKKLAAKILADQTLKKVDDMITLGDHKTYSSSCTDNTYYEEKSLAYDPNRNIKRLVRTNSTGGNSVDYKYAYKGNQLDRINSGTAYINDKNGNPTADGLRGSTLA